MAKKAAGNSLSLSSTRFCAVSAKKTVSIEIIENKELPAEITGGKLSKLDARATIEDGTKTN
ncbi:MAG: hypothetical protein LBG27_07930, partial [Spirochaetaceae bacterium]|nr:hypothetical protein [Spirochaetaceae bacterium]